MHSLRSPCCCVLSQSSVTPLSPHHPTMPGKDSQHAQARSLLAEKIATRITEITNILYNTEVTPQDMEPLHHYFSKDVYFKDPWQQGGGIEKYVAGMNGFHSMLNFDFTDFQAAVTLEEKKRGCNYIEGRAMVDGMMQLRQFSWLYTYPLRTILVYKLRVFLDEGTGDVMHAKKDDIPFQIYFHEEMWSLGGIPSNFSHSSHLPLSTAYILCHLYI